MSQKPVAFVALEQGLCQSIMFFGVMNSHMKDYRGPAVLSYGFRPFFLAGACYSALAIAIWMLQYAGEFEPFSAFGPRDLHVHEMLYGYVPAVVTGFLLTAIPNWTGRLPIQGTPLLMLFLTWAAGRIAINCSAIIGAPTAAIIDSCFLLTVLGLAACEVIAGRNWRNLKVLAPVALLSLGNLGFHVENLLADGANYSTRVGTASVVFLIALIAGRIVPSFTRNWLVRRNPGLLPAPFGKIDIATLAMSAIALAVWIFIPASTLTGILFIAAALLQSSRLARWAGHRTVKEHLVFVLHLAYAFLPLGFLLGAMSAFGVFSPTAGLHAWTTGGIGLMTLAVMTRASLGHTGHALVAGYATQLIYAAVILAAFARIAASLFPTSSYALLFLAATGWVGAYAAFAILHGPILCRPRTQ